MSPTPVKLWDASVTFFHAGPVSFSVAKMDKRDKSPERGNFFPKIQETVSVAKMDKPSKRDKSVERGNSSYVYMVISVTIHSWNSVERVPPIVFSSYAKAKEYCKREALSWQGVVKNGFVRTGETTCVSGNVSRHSLEILGTFVDDPVELWHASYDANNMTVVNHGPFNGYRNANRYIQNVIYNSVGPGSWKSTDSYTWTNRDTGEQWTVKKATATLQ